MSDYISRAELYAAFCKASAPAFDNHGKATFIVDYVKVLESIPAADVRPVVRGKWKQDELSKRLDLYVCSECGQPLQIVNADGGKTATAYCPNCGADMREEQT